MQSVHLVVRLILIIMISAPEIGSMYYHLKAYGVNKNCFRFQGSSETDSCGLLRLRGGGKFDENHAAIDVIQRNSKKGASMLPSGFENLIASTLFTAQVQKDELRMLKYLHIVSARCAHLFLPCLCYLSIHRMSSIEMLQGGNRRGGERRQRASCCYNGSFR